MENTSKDRCPCGTKSTFLDCCGRYIIQNEDPNTAEKLMRSRYTAFSKENIFYLVNTTHPNFRDPDLAESILQWMRLVTTWDRLEIISTQKGGAQDQQGWVKFRAYFHQGGEGRVLEEHSYFTRVSDRWMYNKPV